MKEVLQVLIPTLNKATGNLHDENLQFLKLLSKDERYLGSITSSRKTLKCTLLLSEGNALLSNLRCWTTISNMESFMEKNLNNSELLKPFDKTSSTDSDFMNLSSNMERGHCVGCNMSA